MPNTYDKQEMLETLNDILGRLKDVHKKLRANGYNWSVVFDLEKGNPDFKGLSDSTVSRMKTELENIKNQLHEKTGDQITMSYDERHTIQQSKDKITDIEKAYSPYCLKAGQTNKQEVKKDFIGNSWFLYFFYIKAGSDKTEPALGQAVLHIKDDLPKEKNVKCENITEDGVSQDYIGSYDYIRSGDEGDSQVMLLYFDLKSQKSKHGRYEGYSRLHIKVTCISYKDRISLGGYMTYEHNNITMGSVVLQLVDTDKDEMVPLVLSFNNKNRKIFNNTKPSIRQYLSLKDLNYSKITNKVHTFDRLEELVAKRDLKRELFFFDEDKPVLFISAQNSSISPDKSGDTDAVILNIKQALEKKFEGELLIKYQGKNINKVEFKDNFKKSLEEMKRTRFFVSILTEKGQNSYALAELGMALAFCKSILVFYKEGTLSERMEFLDGLGEGQNRIILQKITDTDIQAIKNADVDTLADSKNSREFLIYDSIKSTIKRYMHVDTENY